MAVPVFKDMGDVAVGSNSTTIDVPYCPSSVAGDLLMLVYGADRSNIATPSGWTRVVAAYYDNANAFSVAFIKVADGSETGDLTITGLGTDTVFMARILCFTGASVHENEDSVNGVASPVLHADIVSSDVDRIAITVTCIGRSTNLESFTGETGADLQLIFSANTTVGSDLTLAVQSAPMPTAGTISGGSDNIITDRWSTISFMLYLEAVGDPDQNLEGVVAADPWVAATGSILGTNQNLSGVVAADPWIATIGVVTVAAISQNLAGVVADDPWIATDGVVNNPLPPAQNLSGVVAADPWIATIGTALNPGADQNLSGVIVADIWSATIGVIFPAGFPQNLSGVVADDPWIAAIGMVSNPLPGSVLLLGAVADDPWIATIGVVTNVGPSQNLSGIIAADPWIATVGVISAIGVSQNLLGLVASDPWLATLGLVLNPVPTSQILTGLIIDDPWTTTIGLLLAPGTGIVPPHELVGMWIPTNNLTGVWPS